MTESTPKIAERLTILHPKIYISAIIVLIVGSFNTLGQKFLQDPDYGNYKHPVFANLGMFFGEYLNYLLFMIACMIPPLFKKINKNIYERVNSRFKIIFKIFCIFI